MDDLLDEVLKNFALYFGAQNEQKWAKMVSENRIRELNMGKDGHWKASKKAKITNTNDFEHMNLDLFLLCF